MECNGKCYLSEKIHQNHTQDDHVAQSGISYYPAAVQYYIQSPLIIFPQSEKHIFQVLFQYFPDLLLSPPVPPPR